MLDFVGFLVGASVVGMIGTTWMLGVIFAVGSVLMVGAFLGFQVSGVYQDDNH